MRRALPVLLVFVVVTACAAAIWLATREGGSGGREAQPAPAETDGGAQPDPATAPAPRAGRERAADPAAPKRDSGLVLAGRVVATEEGEQPIGGAIVEVYSSPAGEERRAAMRRFERFFGDTLDAELLAEAQERIGGRFGAALGADEEAETELEDEVDVETAVETALEDGEAALEAQAEGMELGRRMLADEGAMERLMRFVRYSQAGFEEDLELPLAARTTASGDGAFRVEGLAPGRYELRVRAPLRVRASRKVDAGESDVVVRLAPAARVRGRVLGAGRPLAGAEVRVRTESLATDADGRFVHDGARPPKEPVLVTAAGHVAALRLVPVEPGVEGEEVVFDLEPAGRVSGRVTDRAGAPVEGVLISPAGGGPNLFALMGMAGDAEIEPPPLTTRTAADGTYLLDGLPQGSTRLRAEHPEFLPGSVEDLAVRPGAELRGVDFTLVRESHLAGRVTGADGRPLEGATVEVKLDAPRGQLGMAAQFMGGVWRSARTAADGTYRVESLAEGVRDARVKAKGFLTATRSVTLPAEGGAALDVALEPGHRIDGLVLGPDGSPVPGATVRIYSSGGAANPLVAMMGGGTPDATAVTDVEGLFEATGLQQGPYRVTAAAPAFLDAELKGVEPGAKVSLQLGAAATLRGVVVDVAGAPVPGATVHYQGGLSGRSRNPFAAMLGQSASTTHADHAGRFELPGLEPGTYKVYASARGHADSPTVETRIDAGASAEVELALREGVTLSGRVVSKADGTGVPGVLVFVPRGDGNPFTNRAMSDLTGGEPEAPFDAVSAHTDAAGDFLLEGLTPGPARVEARHAEFAPASVAAVEVPRAGLVVELAEGGAIEGVVRGPEGTPRSGVTVMATQGAMGAGFVRQDPTDARGEYRFERLPAGGYQLMLIDPESPMGVAGMTAVTVRDGETTRHDFGGKPTGRALQGSVLRAGEPVEQAVVVVTGPGGMKMTTTGADGSFSVEGLDPGEYTVLVQGDVMGGGTSSQRVTVRAGERIDDVRLELSALSVRGTVVDPEGRPVSLAQVLLRSGRGATAEDFLSGHRGQAMTDESGAFVMEGVQAGAFTLVATASGFAETRLEGVRAGDQAVRVVMDRGAELVVTVVGPDGQAVREATVVAEDPAGQETSAFGMGFQGITDQAGRATLRLSAGSYVLHVSAAGHPTASVQTTTAARAVTVQLARGGSLEVTVRRADGSAVAGAAVRVLAEDGRELVARLSLDSFFGGGRQTDAEGRATRADLPAGPVTVVVRDADGREVREPARIEPGGTTRVAVTFP